MHKAAEGMVRVQLWAPQGTPQRPVREPHARPRDVSHFVDLLTNHPPFVKIGLNLHYVYPFCFRSFRQRFFELFTQKIVAVNF